MEKANKTAPLTRNRKLLLFLPLAALPIFALLFRAMGGGQTPTPDTAAEKGINRTLPVPDMPDDDTRTKMDYYEAAAADSAKTASLREKDPVYRQRLAVHDSVAGVREDTLKTSASGLLLPPQENEQEQQVYRRLQALQRTLDQRQVMVAHPPSGPDEPSERGMPVFTAEKAALTEPPKDEASPDPELGQMNAMLENILDIQHPDRAEQKVREAQMKARGPVYSVAAADSPGAVGYFGAREGIQAMAGDGNRFFGMEEPQQALEPRDANAIAAVISGRQTLVSGATVKMMLCEDITIRGVAIPRNTFVFGKAELKGERLMIEVPAIRYGGSIFPVVLEAFDLDGLEGLYMPGAITREVAKSAADRSVGDISLTGINDSWSAQAAGAGIEAAKGMLRKKAKKVKVSVSAGYHILLRDKKQKQ